MPFSKTKGLLCFILILTLLVIPATAAAEPNATVTGDGVNVRASASLSATALTAANTGDRIVVVDPTPVTAEGRRWLKVTVKRVTGYMSMDFIKLDEVRGVGTATTIANVKLRSSATVSGKALTTLNKNTRLILENAAPVDDGAEGWYRVTYKTHTGYVRADYLKLELFAATVTPAAPPASMPPIADATTNITTMTNAPTTPVTATADTPPAQLTVGTVTASSLRLRATASTSGSTLATAKKNEQVAILDPETIRANGTEWYKVTYNGATGYMSAEFLAKGDSTAELNLGTGKADIAVNLRSRPNTFCAIVTKLDKGTQVQIVGIEEGWYKVKYKKDTGYLHPDYVSIVNEAALRASANDVRDVHGVDATQIPNATEVYGNTSTTTAKDREVGQASLEAMNPTDWERKLVETGFKYLGSPYVYGSANGKTFDCSGFTSYVYKECGQPIQRTAVSQYGMGTPVNKADLRPGDLVFFKDTSVSSNIVTHVGMYIGQGKFIHAGSGNSGAGRCVKVNDINDNYYSRVYKAARRIV